MTPPRTGFPFLDGPRAQGRVVAMAHRGGARHPDLLGLENTMTAFRHAVELGYDYLETDVHATADGTLVAFHDERLDRVTDRSGRVTRLPWAEVRRARVAGREEIPLFAQLLEEFPGAAFNVDLKSPGAAEPMAEMLASTASYDRVCIGSFDERTLRRFRRLVRRPVATTCGVGLVAAHALASAAPLVPGSLRARVSSALRDDGAVYSVPSAHRGIPIVTAAFVAGAHASGRHVHVWTIDDRAEMERLLDLGVDGLITDRTDVLRQVLTERGLWGPALDRWEDA